jgi:hypothetical protein
MIATRRMIRSLREHSRMSIDNDLEALILQKYGTEPDPYTYTEQDLHEQIRKLVIQHNREQNEAARSQCRDTTNHCSQDATASLPQKPVGGSLEEPK